ncbi:adenosylcobalamin-dependent ribonucleoside-diphosphate reductase [Roseospirillum parvum]|uniref:Vitamin B12-dependent ribonucleotide reductase n=1 Tax=Roseospirillum parvum TaxID=83401 RepID=A0A1G8CSX0_9PROT|nr:adenosylcobalamin-dependent ribonucleoside-diphosphate reductase [Roseospirillum parvum]SDH48572.1 ribonucleoside-diphosphate reductase alpha chain [Roseospirillum parvum]
MAEAMSAVSRRVWAEKYRLTHPDGRAEADIEATWERIAGALAEAESPHRRADMAQRFKAALEDFRFLPGGRIQAGAGAGRRVTLFNCFVMGTIPDSLGGIFDHLKEAALTMQQGGGIGYDFSTIRPRGAAVGGVGAEASGPVSFMEMWDAMCRTVMSAGARRGAMMATLRIDHPDIEAFIEAKRGAGRLTMFNLSVLVPDAFMRALDEDADWPLVFAGRVWRTLPARDLWARLCRAAYDSAEPGVIFIDRVNAANNLSWAETIRATNPCGEQPLPPYGACLLGSVNLARLVVDQFTPQAHLDLDALARLTATAVRMLDNAIDLSPFPLPAQRAEVKAKRRMGLGVTGLADALALLGVRYGSPQAVRLTTQWLSALRDAAYRASIELARERGPFPLFDRARYLAAGTIPHLSADIRAGIAAHGIRNALLTSIAPTGTISLVADNVSSGIEPIFSLRQRRRLLNPDGTADEVELVDHAYRRFRDMHGPEAPLPEAFVTVADLKPEDHLAMQAAAQQVIDSAISKTVNVPAGMPFEAFRDLYREAYGRGLKGLTVYRPTPERGHVLADGAGQAADSAVEPADLGDGCTPAGCG